jgi:hypothetical protein
MLMEEQEWKIGLKRNSSIIRFQIILIIPKHGLAKILQLVACLDFEHNCDMGVLCEWCLNVCPSWYNSTFLKNALSIVFWT